MIWKTIPTLESITHRGKNTLSDFLEMEFIEVGDQFIKARMPVIDKTKQPMGLLHGGATAALAETLGSICAIHCVDIKTESIVGLELNINHIRALKEGFVYSTSTPIHIGKSTQVWNIENTDEKGQIVSIARLTIMVISKK